MRHVHHRVARPQTSSYAIEKSAALPGYPSSQLSSSMNARENFFLQQNQLINQSINQSIGGPSWCPGAAA
jgi:hypothetical protein